MNMPFWRRWVFLWALMPVFSAFFGMAAHRLMHDMVPIQPHHTWGIIFVLFTSFILQLIAPFFVLKRYIRGYGLGFHCLAVLGTLISLGIVYGQMLRTALFREIFIFDREFSFAVFRVRMDPPIGLTEILSLPWGKLLAQNVIFTTCIYAAPVFIICVAAKRMRRFPATMLFVVLAAVVVAVSDAFFEIFRQASLQQNALNSLFWPQRLMVIASWSVSSIIGAGISAIGIGSLLEPRDATKSTGQNRDSHIIATGLRLTAITAAILWSASFSIQYAFGPNGFRSNFAELRKSLESAPEADISVGDNILTFSHLLDADIYRFPDSYQSIFQLSPDNRSAIIREASGKKGSQLAAFDIASGHRIASVSKVLEKYENVFYLWTKDGQHLLVRSPGERIETDHYTRFETKLTLFSLPDYEQVAEWEPKEISCQNARTPEDNMVEDDAGNLIVLCLDPNAEDDRRPLAVQLSLPSLDQISIRAAETAGLPYQLIVIGGSVYAELRQFWGTRSVILANAIRAGQSVTLDEPYATNRGGDLWFNGYVLDEVSDGILGMRFCGETDKVSNPPQVSTNTAGVASFCRLVRFELSDGSYVGQTDDVETHVAPDIYRPNEFSIPFKRWRFTGEINPESRTGHLKVTEAESGALVQTLESSNQRPLVASEELELLFTYRLDTRQIAVYSILH